jgi:capsular exopolysaccharide synthesis family protein
MSSDLNLRQMMDQESEVGGSSPHLSDYWRILTRRLWLVILIFAITTASAIWTVSQQVPSYESTLALQVRDPLERTRSLNPTARISGMEIFVDPIQSEIEVLQSSTIALEVVDALGLELTPVNPELVRSDLFLDVWLADSLPAEPSYELVYDESGERVRLLESGGPVRGSATVGETLDAGFVRFVTRPRPVEDRMVYPVTLSNPADVVGEIRGRFTAFPREATNIVDVSFTSRDQMLAPQILLEAGVALQEYGARKVSVAAQRDVEFIETELRGAREQLTQSLDSIRFKESEEFTNLTLQEQRIVNQLQTLTQQADELETLRGTLAGLLHSVQREDLVEMDLVTLQAELPASTNPQILNLVRRIQGRKDELQRLLTTERTTLEHPRAQALTSQIRDMEGELQDAVEANLRVAEGRLETLSDQKEELREQQRQFPALENRLQELEIRQNLDAGTYELLLSQLYQARIMEAGANQYVDILDPPVGAYEIPTGGRMNILLGALLGLLLGAGAAFFREYLDRTVRTSADVESLLGIPVLGIIPRLRRVDGVDEVDAPPMPALPLVVALDPLDPAAESYRNLRMNLMFMSTPEEPIHSILFTSAGPNEGKSTTAVNFAVMLAQQGERVLLLDADLRRPALHKALDVLREPGLTSLLIGEVELREAIRPNVLPNLDFLPSGKFPPNPSELLNSKAMVRLLEELQGKYQHIIVDSAPVLAVTDSAVLGAHVDGVVLVLRSGETEQRAAERSVDQLRKIGVRVFGAVLNEVAATTPEESYYLQYYYSYGPDEGGPFKRLRDSVSKVRFW